MNELQLPTKDSTLQEIFDFVVLKLREQGAKSMSPKGNPDSTTGINCAYRGDKGRKCAAGHLIPDDQYHPSFEGSRARVLPYFRGWSEPARELVERLQSIHDFRKTTSWETEFQALAERNSLTYTPPTF